MICPREILDACNFECNGLLGAFGGVTMKREQVVARRRPPVRSADSSAELSGLGLAELRAYREALSAEEDKISYWRRLLHGRVDLLEAQASSADTLSLSELVRVLGDTGSGKSRRVLMRIPAPVELPEIPDLDSLGEVWAADPQDADEVAELIERLHAKERRLSEYRNALHQRIDAATGELIMRYKAEPHAALALLPAE